jgi:hypothetical protein
MRKLMTIFLAMICISVGFTVEIMAQSIIISVDGINQEADTLDFGARTVNNPKVDSFYVVNNTNETLYIPADPFFLNRVNSLPGDNTFAEFSFDTIQQRNRPFVIPPQSTLPIKVAFTVDTANKGLGFEADQVFKRARIFVKLSKSINNDTSNIVFQDTIHLTGYRTLRFMKPKVDIIAYDTMYIGTTQTDTLIVYNGTSNQDLQIHIKQNVTNNVMVHPNDTGSFTLPANQFKKIPITYTVKQLADSLIMNALTVTSSPGAISSSEISQISLKSFIAFQRITIDSSLTVGANPIGVAINTDTIFTLVDTIAVGSLSKKFTIAVRNSGSIPIRIDSISIKGSLKDNFFVDKNATIQLVQPATSSAFDIVFFPKLQGPIEADIIVHTNVRGLFSGANPNDNEHIVTVKAFGVSGALDIDFGMTTCDTILTSVNDTNCRKLCSRTYTLSNSGSRSIRVDKITFSGDKSAFTFDPPLNSTFSIEQGASQKFTITCNPGFRAGTFDGTLTFFTPADSQVREFTFISVNPAAGIVEKTITVTPGEVLNIPIIVKTLNASIQLAEIFNIKILIPNESRKGLQFHRFESNKEIQPNDGIEVSIDSTKPEGLEITITTDDAKAPYDIPSDTLGYVHMKYFLNEQSTSELIIPSFSMGVITQRDICYSIFEVDRIPKIIIKPKENSRCADQGTLDALFNDIRIKKTGFSAGIPFSGESVVEIQHFIPETNPTEISLYSVTGEKVETIFSGIAPTELTKIRHPLTNLPKGVYYCELRTGAFRKTIPIVITQ